MWKPTDTTLRIKHICTTAQVNENTMKERPWRNCGRHKNTKLGNYANDNVLFALRLRHHRSKPKFFLPGSAK